MGRSPEWYLYVRPLSPQKILPIACLQNARKGDAVIFSSSGFRIIPKTTTTGDHGRLILERCCSSYGKSEVYMPRLDTEYVVAATYRVDVTNQYGVFRHRIVELLCPDPNAMHTWVLTTEGHILNCESFHSRGTIELNTCLSTIANDSSTGGSDQS